ncbi:Filament-like protein [Parasponia andersonii]|uniref:Filament-like protein n=1 Tax=Parasponia andersonii TaxID=3476 RepID=A0A2P5B2L1_PARAD|nr:Filament-like protein [Parasponia andersonii]
MENNNKAWLWRKKSAEKNIGAIDHKPLRGNEDDQIQALLAEKVELERNMKNLNDRLSSALSECKSKDELVEKHAKKAQESMKGWEKAVEEAVSLKMQLDEALQQRVAGEERVAHLDAALKECMQQLRFVREEQEQRAHDAVMKTSREFEKTQMVLEEKLSETNKRLAKIIAEDSHLGKALMLKEKLIEELNRQLNQVEADFGALMTRLESTEKDNGSLKYEVRVLEKELEIRNEEREFNRRTADASHKQHLESVKKIAKLESECQRLRLLVRKRLPGPAALAKMKSEVEMLGRDSIEMRRKSNPTSLLFDSMGDNSSETPSKKISMLTEQLCAMEEENKALTEVLIKKTNELQSSRNMYARTASQLSQVDSQLEEFSKGRMLTEPRRNSLTSHELSLASMSEVDSNDKVSCAESWASALISELEHFRNEKQKGSLSKRGVGASDINLMDDFVEMEKLAVVSANKPAGESHVSSNEANSNAGPVENKYSSGVVDSQTPVSDSEPGFRVSNQEIRYSFNGNFPVWLHDTLKLVLEQNRATGRNFEEILEDIRVALANTTRPKPGELVLAREGSNHFDASTLSPVRGNVSLKNSSKSLEMDSSCGVIDVHISQSDKSSQQVQTDMSKFICKMIELIEGIGLTSPDYDNATNFSKKEGNFYSHKNSETPYMVRVLQWKTSELSAVLQQYVHACYDVLNGKADLGKFVQELTIALEWIINHCFSLQDVSSMRDDIIKQCDWDESWSESEAEGGFMGHFPEADKAHIPRQQLSHLPSVVASNGHTIQAEELKSTAAEEGRKLTDKLIDVESSKKELEERLQSATDTSEYLTKQLQESEKVIDSLQTEFQAFRKSKRMIEDQIENHKMMNEDLDTQLKVARGELNEARQKFASLEVELENKNHCFEELQATCVELQLQLESVKKESSNTDHNQEQKELRSDQEITAASEKLAECQETILNLGKQLKALATPREAALFDKVIINPSDAKSTTDTASTTLKEDKNTSHRTSLLDQMLAEDDAATKILRSPDTKEIDRNSTTKLGPYKAVEPLEKILVLGGKHQDDNVADDSLAIVPTKKQGGGSLWRKLLWRKKKGNSKKTPLPFPS